MQNLKLPTNLKKLQILTSMIASLNRFIFKYSDKWHPFFKALKKFKVFICDEECDKVLTDLKYYLSNPPLISILESHQQLFLYLSSSRKAISAALIREDDGVQKPVYYVSKSLVDTELNYLSIEKLVVSLVITSRRLRH